MYSAYQSGQFGSASVCFSCSPCFRCSISLSRGLQAQGPEGIPEQSCRFKFFQRLTSPWGTPKTTQVIGRPQILSIGLWIGIFDLADATPSTSALAWFRQLRIASGLPIVRPESAAGVSTLTSIHTKSLQPQLERCQLRTPQPVRTADRSCSRNHL
jgi:hypothetical protein